MGTILIVDDEPDICRAMTLIFADMGHNVYGAQSLRKAMKIIDEKHPDVAFFDVRLGRDNGMDLLKTVKAKTSDITVVMISAFGSVESAVRAMKMGAYDYICKPFNNDEMEMMVKRIFEHRGLVQNNRKLKEELNDTFHFKNFFGESKAIKRTKHLIKKALHSKANVIIGGETGTGKSLVAHIIHHHGPRKDHPFVNINCGAIPENLLESELFGHMKGSFTGAIENKIGLFTKANKGTIFLDEVSELPLNMQVKLLNAIQTKEILPIGSTSPIVIDVRIIAATNVDILEAVRNRYFREDLFYRLNVFEVKMPPLRECRSDIQGLVFNNVIRFAKENDKKAPRVSQELMRLLHEYHWPGNVRELENTLERAVIMCDDDELGVEDVGINFSGSMTDDEQVYKNPEDLKSKIEILEKEYIQEKLKRYNNDKELTASHLNISVATLYRKLKR